MVTKIENIPEELKALTQWVCWVGSDKLPKNPATGNNAQSNNPNTWGTFPQAVKACETFGFDGVGFMFANGYFGVDLDHVLSDTDFVDEFVETLQSYTEISKSGDGIHIICKGHLPEGRKRNGAVEMYQKGRYFICTGNLYNEKYKEVRECTESVKVLHSKYLPSQEPEAIPRMVEPVSLDDREIIDKARNCSSGWMFSGLYSGNWQGAYGSHSEADIALCNHLAFWTQKNPEQMDRIFRTSGLFRKKWDERRGDHTYGEITISRACAGTAEVYEPSRYSDDTSIAIGMFRGKKEVAVVDGKKAYDLTDTGNAHRLYDRFGSGIRYSYNRKKWNYWDGKCWRLDESGEIKKLADAIVEDIKKDAFSCEDDEEQEKMLKFASKSASSHNKESFIKECQHLQGIPASPDAFDAYPEYLNCQNGIVDMGTGELIEHDPTYMLSKICNADYDIEHKTPERWLAFLDDITGHNADLQRYLQKAIGYSISGSNAEQCAFFLYGVGSNGKSTFLDTLADLFGSYASNVQPESFMMSKLGGDGARSDIARLKSTRFAMSEEPTEGVRLNEGLLKQITGGSPITCRFLYGDEFEYTPEFKLWMATNHKPVIRGTDFGIWRRIRLIPFEITIPKEKIDKNLKFKLREEFPQILAWAVEGYMLYKREGLEEPEMVANATAEYKNEMDLIAGFIADCIVVDYSSDLQVPSSKLFELYAKWAKSNNEYEMSSKKFYNELSKKLPDKGRNSKGVYYKNIVITEVAQDLLGVNYSIDNFY